MPEKAIGGAERRSLVQIHASGVDKRYWPSRCYMYVLEPKWSDGAKYKVYRSYGDIILLSKKLADAFPIEAGRVNKKERVLPVLKETKDRFRSKEVEKTAKRRLAEVTAYFESITKLEEKIRVFPGMCSFFEPKVDDVNVPEKARLRPKPKKKNNPFLKASPPSVPEHQVLEITAPVPTQTYRAAAPYAACSKEEISFKEGDLLEVVEKQNVGWWFVRFEGQEGWAPATFLDPVDGTVTDEALCLLGELHITLKAHTARYDDELSFPAGALIEILNKVLDGWWIGSYQDKVGYVPATHLKPSTTGELCRLPSRHGSEQIPRRRTIVRSSVDGDATPPDRDLMPYRRLTTKRKERASRRHLASHAEDDSSNLGVGELYANDCTLVCQEVTVNEVNPTASIKPCPKPRKVQPSSVSSDLKSVNDSSETITALAEESNQTLPEKRSPRDINRAPGTPPIKPRRFIKNTPTVCT